MTDQEFKKQASRVLEHELQQALVDTNTAPPPGMLSIRQALKTYAGAVLPIRPWSKEKP